MPKPCKRVELPSRPDDRGLLTFGQSPDQFPFAAARFFVLYGSEHEVERGDHAHREQHQFVTMAQGAVTIVADDGKTKSVYELVAPTQALLVPPMQWLALKFSPHAICVVFASGCYDEADYVRDYDEFRSLTAASTSGR